MRIRCTVTSAGLAFIAALALILSATLCAAGVPQLPWSQRAANAVIEQWLPGSKAFQSGVRDNNYEIGTLLHAIDAMWLNTADPRYFNYIVASVNERIGSSGSARTFSAPDSVELGPELLRLYSVTQNRQYLASATTLYEQSIAGLRPHGGSAHDNEIALGETCGESISIVGPFLAQYAAISHHPEIFNLITDHFMAVGKGVCASQPMAANDGALKAQKQRRIPLKNRKPLLSGARDEGMYLSALVDSLQYYPDVDPGKQKLVERLTEEADVLTRLQDTKSGLWRQSLNTPGVKGNTPDPDGSSMILYAMAKAIRRGLIPDYDCPYAQRAYDGVVENIEGFLPSEAPSRATGNKRPDFGEMAHPPANSIGPAEDKSTDKDLETFAAFILASIEVENLENAWLGRGANVLVDGWFNSESRLDAFGQQVYFHYKWGFQGNPGYSMFGHIFERFGANTRVLLTEPTASALRDAQVFVIASPDNRSKTPFPHYAQVEDAEEIAGWVKAGGVLMIMENDPGDADLDHFNLISDQFGIHFNDVLRNHVEGNDLEAGTIRVRGDGPVFHSPHTLYMKDTCTISVHAPAESLLSDRGDILMARAKYGKGTVFAVVDPWLYNEYTDGRKLPDQYDNYAAGIEVVRWILAQIPHTAGDGTSPAKTE